MTELQQYLEEYHKLGLLTKEKKAELEILEKTISQCVSTVAIVYYRHQIQLLEQDAHIYEIEQRRLHAKIELLQQESRC